MPPQLLAWEKWVMPLWSSKHKRKPNLSLIFVTGELTRKIPLFFFHFLKFLAMNLDMNKMRNPQKKITVEERINTAWISVVQDIFTVPSPRPSFGLVTNILKQNCPAASSVMS